MRDWGDFNIVLQNQKVSYREDRILYSPYRDAWWQDKGQREEVVSGEITSGVKKIFHQENKKLWSRLSREHSNSQDLVKQRPGQPNVRHCF